MMRQMIWLLAIGLLLGISSPVMADELLSIKAGYQVLSPSGQFAGLEGLGNDLIDLEDDLGFDDSEEFTGEIALSLGNHRLSVAYLPLDMSGFTNSADFTFNGVTYNGTATSDITIDLYEAAYTYYLLNFDDLPSRFQLGLELAVKYADADASVTGTVTNPAPAIVSSSVDGSLPFPTIGVRSRVALGDFFGVAARAGYLEFDDNTFLDAEAQIEFSPFPMVGLYGGYRYLDVDIDESDLLIDATFKGPFVGAFARF